MCSNVVACMMSFMCVYLFGRRRKNGEKKNRKLRTHALSFKVVVHCDVRLLKDPVFVVG